MYPRTTVRGIFFVRAARQARRLGDRVDVDHVKVAVFQPKRGRNPNVNFLSSRPILSQFLDRSDVPAEVRRVAENAWQESEVWILAGHQLPKEWNWNEIRAERDSKEKYYQPFAKAQNAWTGLGQGRKRLGEAAAKK